MIRTLASVVVIAAIFGAGVYAAPYIRPDLPELPSSIRERLPHSASLMIDYGNGTVRTFDSVSVSAEATVFDLLKTAAEENNLALETKDYGGDLGVFIVSIDGVGEGAADKWWQYWINNHYGQAGVSTQGVSEGDIVVLKFVEGQTEN